MPVETSIAPKPVKTFNIGIQYGRTWLCYLERNSFAAGTYFKTFQVNSGF